MAWVIQNLANGGWLTGPRRYESFFEAYKQWNRLNGKYGRYRIAREKIKSMDKEKIRVEGCLIKYDTPLHDGIIFKKGAFQDDNGKCLPIVADRNFHDPDLVVGSMLLENRDDGVYYSAVLNRMPKAKEIALQLKQTNDNLVIGMYANRLQKEGMTVNYGQIRAGSVIERCEAATFIFRVIIEKNVDE